MHYSSRDKPPKEIVGDIYFDYFLLHQLNRCVRESGESRNKIVERAVLRFLDDCVVDDLYNYRPRRKKIMLEKQTLDDVKRLCRIHSVSKRRIINAALYRYFLLPHSVEVDVDVDEVKGLEKCLVF